MHSCLATVSDRHSFTTLWTPPFISRLAPEDRCHLNGVALRDGQARYVTLCGRSDVADGWRDHRQQGGCGGQGDDTLLGGLGNDRLTGGLGADLLIGGAGANLLTAATFVANGAATFTVGGDRFLALNDATAGFQAAQDIVLNITGFSGSISNLAVI